MSAAASAARAPKTPMRICIVTSAHLCNNPRVVKEADALSAAGHNVRVVGYDRWPDFAELDRDMMSTRSWRWTPVCIRPQGATLATWLVRGTVGHVASRAYRRGVRAGVVRDLAFNKYGPLLAAAAMREPADLVIAHYAHALPAAATAARHLGARLAFDAEDLHSGEYPHAGSESLERRLVMDVEREYLRRCHRLTASSPPIAEELARIYGVPMPAVVLNAFPVTDSGATTSHVVEPSNDAPSLYWFSQVVGDNRGLDDILKAMALLPSPVRLSLRGTLDPGFAPRLQQMISEYGLAGRVRILPRVPPAQLVADASQHDIGLALEQPATLNRDLAITNKVFIYMLAGLALAASSTRGQRYILEQTPNAGVLYTPGDAEELAAKLGALIGDPQRLAAAKRASLHAALSRFNWEYERDRLVTHLTDVPPVYARSAELA